MSALFLGLGYLALAAVGAACWGLALASGRGTSRAGGLLVGAGLAALAARAVVVVLLVQQDAGFVQEKVVVGLPLSAAASVVAAVAWFLPGRVRGPVSGRVSFSGPVPVRGSVRRAAFTSGAMAAALAAAIAEVLLTVAIGAPVGAASAVAALAAVAGTGVVTGLARAASG
ncbi:hypothetical protein, partial [Microbacterium sp.]|uniref:hypothetical protein n=1 Tax=Microbacterium sp. TaxID=51671 RepID=UPI0039E3A730